MRSSVGSVYFGFRPVELLGSAALLFTTSLSMIDSACAQDTGPQDTGPQDTGLQDTGTTISTLVSEGIGGYADKKRRAPVLTVRSERTSGGGVKILADAFQINEEFRDYPIKFDFFVNRQLFATQYRSPGLTGPVGVDVGPDTGKPPFNFSVIATVIHPNRSFSSTVEGTIFALDLATTFDSCSLTREVTDDAGVVEDELLVAEKVTFTQSATSKLSSSFTGKTDSGDTERDISVALDLTKTTELSGTITVGSGGDAETTNVTGTATLVDEKLTEIEVANEGETVTLSCS